jgi:hypothetical protein
MKLNEIAPVFISISILILIAVVQKQSRTIAGITATMPVTIPLSLWIVYSSSKGETSAVESYTRGMITGILPTVAFCVALWLGARLGFKLAPMIGIAYGTWAVAVTIMLLLRRWVGV